MAESENTPKTELEAQPETQPKPDIEQPITQETAPVSPVTAPRQGETLEAYAARVKSEMEAYEARFKNEVSWRDRQLTQQHKRIKDRDAKAIEIEAENQRLKEQRVAEPPKPDIPQPQPRQPHSGAVAPDAIAAARVQIEMERTEAALVKNPEWPAALANFQRVGGIPQDFMNAVLDTDDPAYVLVALGRDMNKFTQLMELPEGRRRAALIKIGMEPEQKAAVAGAPKAEPKPKPSEAPAPTRALPSGGAAVAPEGDIDLYDEKYASSDYDDAWYKKRLEQKAASKGRSWSYGGRGGSSAPRN